jgi:hypothetical protein
MQEPGVPSPLSLSRRTIVVALIVAAIATLAASVHDGTIASRWTNGLGLLLGGLAGTYVGEYFERFGGRVAVTRIAWLQMAAIAFLLVAIISWRELPAYCQLPVTFAMGIALGSATIYLQRLRVR